MIRIKDLSISFAGNQLFSKANFNINAKEKIGLIGRNGTGKSTLFKLLNRDAYMQKPSQLINTPPKFRDWRIIDAQALITGNIEKKGRK